MSAYNHQEIEKKWQDRWEESGIFHAKEDSEKKKFYCLIEFPYPSGAGLHIGHPRSYAALDVIARKHRMDGENVLYPIGWDAFGLPTENFAIKMKKKPQEVTKENVDTFRRQLKSTGISFDWSREVNTTDPEYYKWTQWMFLEFFDAGLAYKHKMPINWCVDCKIGLSNEEVVNGACERCGGHVEKREKEQWMIAITKYADRLLEDLDTVDYLPKIKAQQVNWIGKSEGVEIDFETSAGVVNVFTTRPDTIFGVSYIVLAPEHPLVDSLTTDEYKDAIAKYRSETSAKSDIDRTGDKEKTGQFTGSFAKHPFTGEDVPIWIADYCLMHYGTGAVMGVPAHDDRDFAFAKTYELPVTQVIKSEGEEETDGAFTEAGIMVNSPDYNGLKSEEAKQKISDRLESEDKGKRVTTYRLRDWVFSRQRYWGEPIPLVHCEDCGWVPVPKEDLPVTLPEVENYQPNDQGDSPLADIPEWVNTTCPTCDKPAKRETDTMPNWAGSSWYFLRYIDPHNSEAFADKDKLKEWMPVNLYNGGMEHTTLHLLYSRFWNKFLFDRGHVPVSEPYAVRRSHGLILASDGTKMSKSKGNVVNPDEIIAQYGADALRLYEMFIGPFGEPAPWDIKGLIGVRRFLDKVYKLADKVDDGENEELARVVHKTIKQVGADIEAMKFNTAVSSMMICANEMQNADLIPRDLFERFLAVLAPFAPHMAEELWAKLGHDEFVSMSAWPEFDEALTKDESIELAIQVNGKLRGTIQISPEAEQEEAEAAARANANVAKYLEDGVKKVIYVKGRMMNFVV